jgi:adhesin/invasin
VPPGELAISPSSITLAPGESSTFIVVGGTPPYNIAASGGTLDKNQVAASGGSFTYTAGTQTGSFEIFAIDTAGKQAKATVTITAESAQVAKIIVEATPLSVNGVTGGTSTITASVFNSSNQPIQGVSILFETTTGTVSSLTVTTNASGQASTTLTILPGTPAGVATVSASAGGVSGSVDVSIVTSSAGPAGPPADIFVDQFADRSGDNNDGTCTTILSALVVDAEGNPVNDGTQVNWQIGQFADCGFNSASSSVTTPSFTNQAPPCNVGPYQASTGINVTPQPGDALACLKYPQKESANLVFITAKAGTNPVVSASCTMITLPPCSPVVTVVLQTNPTSVSGAAGGTSTIEATALNGSNKPIPGVTIVFTTMQGTVNPLTAITNGSGQASVTLTIPPGTATGTATVTGTAPGSVSGKVDVTITP